MFLKIWGYLSK